jgi:tetraacyldisaccharide 4'-kinase
VKGLLGRAFGAVAALRVTAYQRGLLRRSRLLGPVISVGNLSVGGSGKTPVVAYLAALVRDAGLPVAILSRGYRGSFRGSALVVGDGRNVLATAEAAGDEPVMLARQLEGVVVAVGRRRDEVGRAVEARFGRRVHILDDGFQHLRLLRDLDVLCVDLRDLRDRPLPAGRLREGPAAARRADLALITGPDDASPEEMAWSVDALGAERTHLVRRRPLGFFDRAGAVVTPPARPYLLAGIARPERFEADVRTMAGAPVGRRFFRDHHPFTAADRREVEAEALRLEADAIVTTAKDLERLPSPIPGLPLLVLRLSIEVSDEARLRTRVLEIARRAA